MNPKMSDEIRARLEQPFNSKAGDPSDDDSSSEEEEEEDDEEDEEGSS